MMAITPTPAAAYGIHGGNAYFDAGAGCFMAGASTAFATFFLPCKSPKSIILASFAQKLIP